MLIATKTRNAVLVQQWGSSADILSEDGSAVAFPRKTDVRESLLTREHGYKQMFNHETSLVPGPAARSGTS